MSNRIDNLKALLDERIVLLDGSWGVLLQRRLRSEEDYRGEWFRDHSSDVGGDPDLLNLTQPDVILELHREYFAAGADIATTNTFTATSIGQADYSLQEHVAEMNLAGARLARQAADEVGGFVAGSLGPLNRGTACRFGTCLGLRDRVTSTKALTCSGVVPQQPPITLTRPDSANSRT